MTLDIKTILHTADLARLDLSVGLPEGERGAALKAMEAELDRIVGYFGILDELDCRNVAPLWSTMEDVPAPREDEPRAFEAIDELLDQAPERDGNFFVVPKVL